MIKNRNLRKGEGEFFLPANAILCFHHYQMNLSLPEFVLYVIQDDEARTPCSQDLATGIYTSPQE